MLRRADSRPEMLAAAAATAVHRSDGAGSGHFVTLLLVPQTDGL